MCKCQQWTCLFLFSHSRPAFPLRKQMSIICIWERNLLKSKMYWVVLPVSRKRNHRLHSSALENLMMINKAYNMMRKVKDIVGDEIADDEYLKVRYQIMYQSKCQPSISRNFLWNKKIIPLWNVKYEKKAGKGQKRHYKMTKSDDNFYLNLLLSRKRSKIDITKPEPYFYIIPWSSYIYFK